MRSRIYPRKESGFSVVELSFLITIFALAALSYLALTTNSFINDAQKIKITKDKMQVIEDAILNFRNTYNRLPCGGCRTASGAILNYTYNNVNYNIPYDAECIVNTNYPANSQQKGNECILGTGGGSVPTKALGISPEYMKDGWGRYFLYHISPKICGRDSHATTKNCTPDSYQRNLGDIKVVTTVSAGTDVTTTAVYVLVSHGPNGYGAILPSNSQFNSSLASSDELENQNFDLTYVSKSWTSNYDDIVMYKTKSQIESLAINTQAPPISLASCQNNSYALQSLKYINTDTLGTASNSIMNIRVNMSDVEKTNTEINLDPASRLNNTGCRPPGSINTYNCGDEAVIDIMWSLQDACTLMYPSFIKLCPGGGAYDAATDSCTCNNRSWNGSC